MKKSALFVGVLVLSGAVLADCQEGYCLQPYAGADAQIKRGFRIRGSKKQTPHVNVYAGLKFNDYIGLEIGSHVSKSVKTATHKLRTHAFHASAVGFAPVSDTTELLAGVGLSHFKGAVTAEHKINLNKTAPRIIVGLNCKLVEGLNVRPSIIWENSKTLKHVALDAKNSLHYGVGLNFAF